MGSNGGQALVSILTFTAGGLVPRQLKNSKRRDSESTSRTHHCSFPSKGNINPPFFSELLGNKVYSPRRVIKREGSFQSRNRWLGTRRQLLVFALVRPSPSRVLRRHLDSNSRPDDASREENEALRWNWDSNSRMDEVHGEEYDVFLSFKGNDICLNLTDYLYRSMIHAGTGVFLDKEKHKNDKKLSEASRAANKPWIYIPIFSQNFASGIWCLDEVDSMVGCHLKSNGNQEIIPIFHDVNADDVKLRTDLYKMALLKYKKKFAPKEVQQWESALETVGKKIGQELQGKCQAELIESIVEGVSCKLNTRQMIETENLVEDGAQVEAIMKLLDVGSDGVCFIGIHGIGYVGKTTLAKVIFNELSFHFEGCCFLEDVRALSQTHDGLLDLQKTFLSDFFSSGITDQIKDADGIKMIKDVFNNKKVLMLLADLDEKEQFQNLSGKADQFCSGSRIVVTTRDKSILTIQVKSPNGEVVNQPEIFLAYEVHRMSSDLALYEHAFRSDSAVEEYEDLTREIVRKVHMLPLAVVASHLFSLGNHLRNSDRKEVCDLTLKNLEEGFFHDVRDALMISYEWLKDIEKGIFLDIACFFTNKDSKYPVIMWKDCGYHSHTAIEILSHRSLNKIRDDNRFWMQNHAQDFGRDIFLQEYPHKICRMWTFEKDREPLEAKQKIEDVKALSLQLNGSSFTGEELAYLPKPEVCRAKEFDFSDDFENFHSEQRWLSQQAWQMTFHTEAFNLSKLVVLDLSNSNIKDSWVGWNQMKMNKLKVLDLTGCVQLKMSPDFSNCLSLEKLILARCVRLTTIHSSIGKLKYLATLNIKGCKSLQELPATFGSLQSLTEIIMPQNFQPFKLPDTFGNLQSLSSFILDEHPGIRQLPNSIGGLVKLKCLSLRGCVGIKKLPCSIGQMKMLAELDLSKSGIVELPDSIGNLGELKMIRVSYTVIKKFPHTIGQVKMLEELHAKKCWCLTDENLEEIGKLFHLRILDLSFTCVSRLPTDIGRLSHLQTLELGSAYLQEAPAPSSSLTWLHLQSVDFSFAPDLSGHVNLDYLELSRLSESPMGSHDIWTRPPPEEVQSKPEERPIHQLPSGLSTLKLNGISSLPSFSNLKCLSVLWVTNCPMSLFTISPELVNLKELKLSNCEYLEEIRGLSLLKNLWCLHLNRLERLVGIQGLSELESLVQLCIYHCNTMKRLPDLSMLDRLQRLELKACQNIRAIEGVKGLESLELDIHNFSILERLQCVSSSTWLSCRIPMYDVFLSFRGSDSRFGIISFLRKGLAENLISVFRDEEVRFGDDVGRELLLALDKSRVYMPVFSKDYASSQWCLYELVHMVRRRSQSKGERRIIPIFYDVEIDDVKLESNLYSSALDEHRKNFDHSEVNAWKEALIEVAAMKGFVLKTNSCTIEQVLELATEEVLRHLTLSNARRRTPGGEDLWQPIGSSTGQTMISSDGH